MMRLLGSQFAERWLYSVALFALATLSLHGQTVQFLPEVDTYYRLNPLFQVYFQVKETREDGVPTQAEVGPSLQINLKRWRKLRNATIFDLNEDKKRPLTFAIGYRYLPSYSVPAENRLRLDLTARFPLKWKVLISDRNRVDLDWQSGKFMWRYRNKITVERQFTISSYHPGPYVSAETFYDSKYQKLTTTALYAGCSLPIGKRFQFEPYYEHQNNTAKSPNQTQNQVGLILGLYF